MNLQRAILAAVVSVSFTAFAQAKPAEPAKKADDKAAAGKPAEAGKPAGPPPAPVMPPEGKRWVDGWLGSWKSNDVALKMGDQELKGKMTMKCDKAAGGWAAVCNGKMEAGKDMKQEVVFVMGWSLGEGHATMGEVTSVGEVHHHTGKWTDEKTITVVHSGKNPEGKDEKDEATFTWDNPKQVTLKAVGTSGGQTLWSMSAVVKK